MKLLPLFLALALSSFAADPSLLRLVPDEAQGIAGISVRSALASPLGRFALSKIKDDDPRLREFIHGAGFDPRRDVEEIVMASGFTAGKSNGLIVARGVFNGAQLAQYFKTQGGRSTFYKGVELIEAPNASGGAVAFLDGSVALGGDPLLVKKAIDRHSAGAAVNAKFAARAAELTASYDIWFVSRASEELMAGIPSGESNPAAAALKAIQESSGGVKLGTVVRFNAEAVTRSAADATALVDVFRFFSGLLEQNAQKQKTPLPMLAQRAELTAKGNQVYFSLSMPQAEIEQMLTAPKRSPHVLQ